MCNGYSEDAWFFPISFVYDEASIILARENRRIYTEGM